MLPAKVKDEGTYQKKVNCTGMYSRGLMNQNTEHLLNLCELNILEINTKSFLMFVLHMTGMESQKV